MSICSNCKQEIRKEVKFCNNCGKKVNSYKTSSASGDTEKNEAGMANCPYCKEEIRADSEFCGDCGRHIYLNSKNEALLQPDKDVSSNVNSADYWNARGAHCILEKNYGEAIKYFDKALEIDPDYSMAIQNKSTAEAMKYFDKTSELNPDYYRAEDSKKEDLLQIRKEENLSISSKPVVFEFSTLGLPDFEETSLLWFTYDNELIYYQGNKETKLHPSDEDWERLWEIMEQIQAWEWHET